MLTLIQGYTDDIAVSEMAACVERRGWRTVVVEGDHDFRCEIARELLARGIEVEDCPLLPEEVSRLLQSKTDSEAIPAMPEGAVVTALPAY